MKFIPIAFVWLLVVTASAQPKSINVIGYFSGSPQQVENIQAEKLTHVIFSFCHLKENQLHIDSKNDSLTIKKLVELKKKNPQLKVMLSLGGWGGCAPSSDAFSTAKGREEFAASTFALNK